MEFLIVSGLSGGGKSRAADVLEDLDFYCVDNLPTALLTKFAELCLATRGRYEKVALVTDIRSQESFSELWHPYRIPNPPFLAGRRSCLHFCSQPFFAVRGIPMSRLSWNGKEESCSQSSA